ncbi:SHOCT domain-containing protein [Actinoplanes cyaneus]|uniref:SHOCT domain-containing protein n=1 Tax=Actinoplanes cyaneus TaxID=52696 RepID=UPI001EF1E5C1|nr:SHOCT domain-containing protein [Actinoplanes cyaneus]
MIAGTATAVSNRVSRRQAGRWSRQNDEQYADQPVEEETAEPEQDPMTAKLDQLRQLGELKTQGLLTATEFEVQKSKILNS